MSKSDESLSSVIFGLVVVVGLIPVSAIMHAWALFKLWGWFVVETFGVPTPTMATLFGLTLIVGLLTHQSPPKEESKSIADLALRMFGAAVLSPLFIVLLGYCAAQIGGAK